MVDRDIHEFSRALGSLEASVTNLTKTWSEQERNASEGRRALHQKMDGIKDDVFQLGSRVDKMSEDISEITPAVNEFKDARQQAIGARKFGRWIWGAMLTAAGFMGWAINEWLHLPKSH